MAVSYLVRVYTNNTANSCIQTIALVNGILNVENVTYILADWTTFQKLFARALYARQTAIDAVTTVAELATYIESTDYTQWRDSLNSAPRCRRSSSCSFPEPNATSSGVGPEPTPAGGYSIRTPMAALIGLILDRRYTSYSPAGVHSLYC